jgi:hypothetical protein
VEENVATGVDASVEAGADAVLRVQLLGPFAIHRGGHPLMLPASRKLRALFGHLALAAAAGRPRRLCELLWEGPDDPRGELRGPLSKLRQAIDTPARPRLITGDDRVRLDLDGCVVDVIEVEQAIAAILKKRLIWPRRRRCSRPRGITAASGTCTASRPPTIFRRGIFSEWRCGSIRPSRVPARHCRSAISSAFQGWGWDARQPAIDRAFEAAGQSLLVDDRDPAAHRAMGRGCGCVAATNRRSRSWSVRSTGRRSFRSPTTRWLSCIRRPVIRWLRSRHPIEPVS